MSRKQTQPAFPCVSTTGGSSASFVIYVVSYWLLALFIHLLNVYWKNVLSGAIMCASQWRRWNMASSSAVFWLGVGWGSKPWDTAHTVLEDGMYSAEGYTEREGCSVVPFYLEWSGNFSLIMPGTSKGVGLCCSMESGVSSVEIPHCVPHRGNCTLYDTLETTHCVLPVEITHCVLHRGNGAVRYALEIAHCMLHWRNCICHRI